MQVVAVAWVLLSTAFLGALLGVLWQARSATATVPGDDSVDAGFSRDMQQHHAQAVQMSLLVLERSTDETVRTLATDVMLTQQQQAGQMYGWLAQWGLTQTSSAPPMAWASAPSSPGMAGMPGMDHDVPEPGAVAMPGMASDQDIDRLSQASAETADAIYLELMIPHHEAGAAMAEAAATRAEDTQVRSLARRIATAQSAELQVLRELSQAHAGT